MLGKIIQHDDWKTEKHVPLIECADRFRADESTVVTVSVGKKIAHPNTTEHHIRWIELYFHPQDEKFAYQVARFEFNAHGESVRGANRGPVYTNHIATTAMTINKPGKLHALSYCNIHGLWESEKEIGLL